MSNTYSQGSSIPANLSVSLSLNALSHAKLQTTDYLVVHDSEKVSCISMQGSSVLSSKEITFEAANDDNRNFIQIAKLLLLHSKIFLVVASSKTVKVYVESHGLQEVFTYGLSSENKLGQIVHSVHSLSKSVFAVATESKVHIFAVGRGASIKVKDVQHEFKSKVRSVIHVFFSNGNGTCAVVEGLPSSGNGLITVSKFEESKSTFSEAKQIAVHLNTKATGLQLYNSLIVLVTISGQIQLISSLSGLLLCEIHAHVRCIGAFDIAPKTGLLVTVSEDSHLRVFRIEETEGDQCKVEHVFQTNVTNEMICGVKFLNATGSKLALCTYESSQIKVFEQL